MTGTEDVPTQTWSPRRGLVVTLLVVIGIPAVVLLVWRAPEALYRSGVPAGITDQVARVQAASARTQAIATTRAAFVAGLAGLAALGGLWVNSG